MPTHIYKDIYEITPEMLLEAGIRALILDIDNTLVTYDDPRPTQTVAAWLDAMHKAGIQTSFVSNNGEPRVAEFCSGMDCYYHAKSGKPSAKYLREAMKYMGTTEKNTACIGDQLFTDVCAGKRAGMRAYLVPPIKDKTTLFFKAKRALEKPFLRLYYKKNQSLKG